MAKIVIICDKTPVSDVILEVKNASGDMLDMQVINEGEMTFDLPDNRSFSLRTTRKSLPEPMERGTLNPSKPLPAIKA
jgi:hypothetical protein